MGLTGSSFLGSATRPATSIYTTLLSKTTGESVFVATLFGCLATLSERHCFQPLWRSPFISRLAAEDRCHFERGRDPQGQSALCHSGEPADLTILPL